ncbi:MAG: GSCFA domain-containing protein [Lachnoclostridium sp.]|nr:GSCFA domain-containing protein [Lachnoclostridium sp.]
MRFRTEIQVSRGAFDIGGDDKIVMLGSCFTDEVGERLLHDGFDVVANPLGPIYNPIVLARTLRRALDGYSFSEADLMDGPRGSHCLEYATRYSGAPDDTLRRLNEDFSALSDALANCQTLILTLGTAYVFEYQTTGAVVGNCHKFHDSLFTRRRLHPGEVVDALEPVLERLSKTCNIILTVSPIRHLADGLHGNTLSKSTLHLAADILMRRVRGVEYFPAFEILVDDLRDYRFYAEDMKHPSPVAVDYIYEIFSNTYFNETVKTLAIERRRQYKQQNHRQIL